MTWLSEIFKNKGLKSYEDNSDPSAYKNALDRFNRSLRWNPRNAQKLIYRANTFYKLGELQKALEDYNKAEKLGCNKPELYANRGIVKTELGVSGASKDFTKAIELDDRYEYAYFHRALLNYNTYDKKQLNKSIKDLDKSVSLVDAYLLTKGNKSLAFLVKAAVKYKLGDVGGAKKDFFGAIDFDELNTKEELAKIKKPLDNYDIKKVDYMEERPYWEVEEGFDNILSIVSNIKSLTKDINNYPNDKEFQLENFEKRAKYKFKISDFEGAIDDYTEVIGSDNINIKIDGYKNRALAFYLNGEVDNAMKDFKNMVDCKLELMKVTRNEIPRIRLERFLPDLKNHSKKSKNVNQGRGLQINKTHRESQRSKADENCFVIVEPDSKVVKYNVSQKLNQGSSTPSGSTTPQPDQEQAREPMASQSYETEDQRVKSKTVNVPQNVEEKLKTCNLEKEDDRNGIPNLLKDSNNIKVYIIPQEDEQQFNGMSRVQQNEYLSKFEAKEENKNKVLSDNVARRFLDRACTLRNRYHEYEKNKNDETKKRLSDEKINYKREQTTRGENIKNKLNDLYENPKNELELTQIKYQNKMNDYLGSDTLKKQKLQNKIDGKSFSI